MRSRSHRLFVILFHIIVFHIPQNNHLTHYAGMIIGVHPSPISLERIKLNEYTNGLIGFMNQMILLSSSSSISSEGTNSDDFDNQNILKEPVWIQDDVDDKCLGPSGSFSDCGDANLWFIRAKKDKVKNKDSSSNNILTKGIQRIFHFFTGEEPAIVKGDEAQLANWKFALQLSNRDMSSSSSSSDQNKESNLKEEKGGECLILLKNRKDNSKHSFRLRSCDKESAWNWNVNGEGYLMSMPSKKQQLQHPHLVPNIFIWRDWNSTNASTKSSSTLVAPCVHDDDDRNGHSNNNQYRQVSFSLVRLQQAGTISSTPATAINSSSNFISNNKDLKAVTTAHSMKNPSDNIRKDSAEFKTPSETKGHVPHSMTASESHAHASLHHLELLPMNSLRIPPDTATNLLKGGNPLLFHSKDATSSSNFNNLNKNIHSSLGGGGGGASILRDNTVTTPISISRSDPTKQTNKHHIIKIPSHPYITESKGTGIWTDESTELKYPTDLVAFLGNERKTHGRHTLMGVGQYTRTVFKVKIYGVALYVSKRDVLADSTFSKYAALSTEELQSNDEFYKYLYTAPADDGTASFDRTLIIKLNMQLGVETIRTCLQSEWKYLTDEHKDMLIGSSLKKRDADEEMLGIIKDKENTSHCSCSQIAPEEYEADSTCCARGTEMVFTWRKDGRLELRMNRRYIDSFPSDIAEGIFYEYLRVDDPMSVEARLNFATGFPFLLAPLAQVKGVVVGGKSNIMGTGSNPWSNNEDDNYDDHDRDAKMKPKKTNPFLIDIGHTILKQSKNVLVGSVSNVCHVAQSGLGTLQEAGTELQLQVTRLSHHTKSILSTGKLYHQQNKQQLSIHIPTSKDKTITTDSVSSVHATPFSFDNTPYIDEIAVNMPPTNSFTHKLFSCVVHLYLLLLLVISIPESYNIRTIRMVANTSKEEKLSPKSKNNKTIACGTINNDTASATTTNSGNTDSNSKIKVVRTSFSRNTSFVRVMPIIEEVDQEEEKEDAVDGIFYDDDGPTTTTNSNNMKKSLSYFI